MSMITTPAGIRWFLMRTQLSAFKLENMGLRHSKGNIYKHVKGVYRLTGSRVEVYKKFETMVNETMVNAQKFETMVNEATVNAEG